MRKTLLTVTIGVAVTLAVPIASAAAIGRVPTVQTQQNSNASKAQHRASAQANQRRSQARYSAKPASLIKILQRVQKAGYRVVSKAEYSRTSNTYRIKAYNNRGNMVRFNVNPRHIVIPNLHEQKTNLISMLDATKKLAAAGYNHIRRISLSGNTYHVMARNVHGRSVKVSLNASNGKITPRWQAS